MEPYVVTHGTMSLNSNLYYLFSIRGVTILQIHKSIGLSISRSQFNYIFDLNNRYGSVIVRLLRINTSLVLCSDNLYLHFQILL